jgi:lysophospholipase L1-like esterase
VSEHSPHDNLPDPDEAAPRAESALSKPEVDETDRPHFSLRKKLLFTFILLVLIFGGAEVVCRLLGFGRTLEVAHYVSDWHESPDGRRFWVVRGRGYNRDGMRDRDHTVEKPADTFRVVCLGDSVTAGHGIRMKESYPYVLEAYYDQLNLPVQMEVFNIAASGWSTLQQVAAYRTIARRYEPDQVFLGFCLNDVAEMQNNLQEPPPLPVRFLVNESAFVRWLVNAEGRQVHDALELFEEPPSPAVAKGWQLVFDELLELQADTKADGCDLAVVMFPFRFQLKADAPEPVAQRTLFAFCFKHDIPCYDLVDVLKPLGPDALIDESHLSPAAARAVAEAIVRWGLSGCSSCGYDLTDFEGDRCPRCQAPIRR